MLNHHARSLFDRAVDTAADYGCTASTLHGAAILDAGVEVNGSLEAGILLSRLCFGDRAQVEIVPCDVERYASHQAVWVRTDHPLLACLGAQYAGWPLQTDDYFAMGSGPMRLARGREPVLEQLQLSESPDHVVGILESTEHPTQLAIELIGDHCGVAVHEVRLAIAPSTSIAGSVQVVSRSVETAMHKLHELKFDVGKIVSATGLAPLPPPCKPGDTVGGIGRTNDAILYGASVTLWVNEDDEPIESVIDQVPSRASSDYGLPFARIFKQYEYDFYKVDPMLFSPAVVTIHSLRSGRTWTAGSINSEVLRQSFIA